MKHPQARARQQRTEVEGGGEDMKQLKKEAP